MKIVNIRTIQIVWQTMKRSKIETKNKEEKNIFQSMAERDIMKTERETLWIERWNDYIQKEAFCCSRKCALIIPSLITSRVKKKFKNICKQRLQRIIIHRRFPAWNSDYPRYNGHLHSALREHRIPRAIKSFRSLIASVVTLYNS